MCSENREYLSRLKVSSIKRKKASHSERKKLKRRFEAINLLRCLIFPCAPSWLALKLLQHHSMKALRMVFRVLTFFHPWTCRILDQILSHPSCLLESPPPSQSPYCFRSRSLPPVMVPNLFFCSRSSLAIIDSSDLYLVSSSRISRRPFPTYSIYPSYPRSIPTHSLRHS